MHKHKKYWPSSRYSIEKLKGSKKLRPFFSQFEMSSSSSCMEKKIDHKLLHKAWKQSAIFNVALLDKLKKG